MLLIADVHGAAAALRRVAHRGETLLVLGDLINLVDYRTYEGIIADVNGREFVARVVALRTAGRFEDARAAWRANSAGREDELRRDYERRIDAAYVEICAALEGCRAYVTYGNVDRPEVLRRHLPPSATFVDAAVESIDGLRVGFAGGGMITVGTPGEIDEDTMAAKLADIGPVDILCTHVAPAVAALSRDVIAGSQKGSRAVRDYLLEHRPRWHYFGDIHQPQATAWTVGETRCRNVGYFRATGRAVRHD